MPADPGAAVLRAALATTWPPAETRRLGPFLLRRGAGGGRRVSAATLEGPLEGADPVAEAEAAMRDWGQRPLFQVWAGDAGLAATLDARGYGHADATRVLVADVAALAAMPWGPSAIVGTAPIAVMRGIWAAGGIGPDRLAVMARVEGSRAWLLGRLGDRPVAACFVACAGRVAMLHALEVAPAARRRGVGTAMTRGAAAWAALQGAEVLALAVLADNAPASTAYERLGMREVAAYHYRGVAD